MLGRDLTAGDYYALAQPSGKHFALLALESRGRSGAFSPTSRGRSWESYQTAVDRWTPSASEIRHRRRPSKTLIDGHATTTTPSPHWSFTLLRRRLRFISCSCQTRHPVGDAGYAGTGTSRETLQQHVRCEWMLSSSPETLFWRKYEIDRDVYRAATAHQRFRPCYGTSATRWSPTGCCAPAGLDSADLLTLWLRTDFQGAVA